MIYILRGEGIECENESFRAFHRLDYKCDFLNVPDVLKEADRVLEKFQKNDWLFLPGGFSFADHLGSGRLLAYELSKSRFFERLIDKGVSLFGVCNGFQILVASRLFGQVKLLHNKDFRDHSMHFTDMWTTLESKLHSANEYSFPVRHGEGRLVIEELAPQTEAWIYYSTFINGSDSKIAGLKRNYGSAQVFGMMPHPEIFYQVEAHPDFTWSEDSPETRKNHIVKYKTFFDTIFQQENK